MEATARAARKGAKTATKTEDAPFNPRVGPAEVADPPRTGPATAHRVNPLPPVGAETKTARAVRPLAVAPTPGDIPCPVTVARIAAAIKGAGVGRTGAVERSAGGAIGGALPRDTRGAETCAPVGAPCETLRFCEDFARVRPHALHLAE